MTGSVLQNLKLLAGICGQRAMPNAVIATTMWGKVDKEEGEEREEELKSAFWKDALAAGCKTERFELTYESAWHIIGDHPRSEAGAQILGPGGMVDELQQLAAEDRASRRPPMEEFTKNIRRIFSWLVISFISFSHLA